MKQKHRTGPQELAVPGKRRSTTAPAAACRTSATPTNPIESSIAVADKQIAEFKSSRQF
jgi:hypothetical protein